MLDDAREETVSQSGNGEPGTQEAEALAAALNHSAERVQTLWFSFLTFMLYLAIATWTTTHRILFLASPLTLPVLNIPLPLLGFYILAPIIFVVFHFYMLLNLVLLARTAKSFEDALVRAFPEDSETRENFRMRIENTVFVQLLVGGRLEREGINAWFLEVMAFITLALGPAVLLLMFEIMFLPYHSESITWLHRVLLLVDLVLVWTLWPAYRSRWGVISWSKRSWRLVAPGVLSAVVLAYAMVVATFPDEQIYVATHRLQGLTYFDPFSGQVLSRNTNWDAFFAPVNTLDLHGEDLIDDVKLAHILEKNESSTDSPRWVSTLPLAKRDLTGADLGGADVRHIDFTDAILNRANLRSAWAKKANFAHAWLLVARLDSAQLQAAWLDGAHLLGASLTGAELQGAYLNGAQLQGASLDGAQLQGADLGVAQLQAAWLDGAQLQGASLDPGAQLQGASLDHTQLQGAQLDWANLKGASFVDVCAWRADARLARWEDTRVARPETCPIADKADDKIPVCDWTAASFVALKQLIADVLPEGAYKRAIMERIEQNLDPAKARTGEDEMAKIWAAHDCEAAAPEANVKYAKSLAEEWQKVGCAAEGAPYVLHALIERLSSAKTSPLRDQSDAAKALAADFLRENCAGAHGLSDDDKAALKKLAAPAAPQAPKP